jgi:nitrate reductase NapAB chaperone NapD
MPVSGLLLTIERAHEPALRQTLAADARTSAGDTIGGRLVVALDTPSRHADREAWAWLSGLPGVRWIDLVWVSFDAGDDETIAAPAPSRRGGDQA